MAILDKKLVQGWLDAWNAHDLEKTLGYYADDCLYESPGGNMVTKRSKKELAPYLKNLFADYPDFKMEWKSAFYSENAVCGEFVLTGTQANNTNNPAMPMTGKSFSVRGSYFSEWQNNKVKRHTIYEDYMTVMAQLGLMPGRPSK
jgi:steroid delta-isomerase-like uncharacterized protein